MKEGIKDGRRRRDRREEGIIIFLYFFYLPLPQVVSLKQFPRESATKKHQSSTLAYKTDTSSPNDSKNQFSVPTFSTA